MDSNKSKNDSLKVIWFFTCVIVLIVLIDTISTTASYNKSDVEYCDIYHSSDFIVKNIKLDTIETSNGYISYKDDGKTRIFSMSTGYVVLCK